MTRYSRSVIPGRPDHGRQGQARPHSRTDSDTLDRQLFGEKRLQAANEDAPQQEAREAAQRDAAGVGRQDFRLLPDEDGGYRPPPESRRAPILLVGVALTAVVFAAVVFNAYRQGVRPADAEVAPQLASIDSFKTKPTVAAGADAPAPAQPSVFDAIEGGPAGSPPPAVREVRPEPAPPPAAGPASSASSGAPIALAPAAAPKVDSPKPAIAKLVVAKPVAPTKVEPADGASPTPPPLVVPAAAPAVPAPVTPAPAPALVGAYKPPFVSGGAHLVQVAAAGTEAAAIAEWDRRTRSWPELLQGAERVIVRADVNGRTVYRVRAGAFATAAEADGFCAAVKGRGGDCFRTAR